MHQLFALLKNQVARPRLWLLVAFSWAAGGLGFAQLPATFYNDANYTYPPQSPNFVATNFYNDYGGTFSMNTAAFDTSWSLNLYNGWQSTLNFTNFGEMDSSFGFYFDRQNGTSLPAANFFNQGTINCGTGDIIFSTLGLGGLGVINVGFGGFFINATNVVNNGSLNVGLDGLGRVWGQNVDLTRGTFSMDGGIPPSEIFGVGEARENTNNWEPDVDLTANSAISAPIRLLGGPLFLFPSLPYFSVVTDGTGTNVTVRMVFIEDISGPNVTNNVYFGGAQFGTGFTTVGWAGTYTDYASGDVLTNYVYLNDDYVEGSSTNILNFGGGIPPNYTFQESTTPLNLGSSAVSSFPSIFPSGPFPPGQIVTTNIYSYVDASLIGSTVPLSSTFNGALTNIVGRFEVAATNELNLSLTEMSGMNYVQLRSTNNFDYDGQSFIVAPYADFYLGRTNNSLAITNLIQSQIPAWSGFVQAWNTRWFYTDTNAGINYDFRVLLVQSDLQPTAVPLQQDVMLYSTNNVIVSDTLNILRNFYVNCTNLVTTTNGFASGAGSSDGELNLLNATNLTWQNSTPFLRNLTNGGAIRTFNAAIYGTPAVPYFAFYNNGVISNGAGCSICSGDFENYGAISSGTGTFAVEALNSTMTNSSVTAGAAFTNVSSTLIVSNVSFLVGKGMTFIVTNLFTDEGATNNFWSLGLGNAGSGIGSGLMMPLKPALGDILLTTITNIATTNTLVNLTWAGNDLGISNQGYSNNAAIGQMIFDARSSAPRTAYAFNAAGSGNAMYVDQIILVNAATNLDSHGNVAAFSSFNNLNIYYGDVIINGVSVAEKLNGKNSNHLHWVSTYAGVFSGTNIVYAPGVTNRVNFALANSPDLDSNGNGIPNVTDPDPIFTPSQVDFTQTLTNNPPPHSVRLQWHSIPASTNYLLYTTNLTGGHWFILTNFISPTNVPPVTGWPLTNTVYDLVNPTFQKFYQVHVDPNSVDLYGP